MLIRVTNARRATTYYPILINVLILVTWQIVMSVSQKLVPLISVRFVLMVIIKIVLSNVHNVLMAVNCAIPQISAQNANLDLRESLMEEVLPLVRLAITQIVLNVVL